MSLSPDSFELSVSMQFEVNLGDDAFVLRVECKRSCQGTRLGRVHGSTNVMFAIFWNCTSLETRNFRNWY